MKNGKDLLAYLAEIIDMEKSIYLQEELLENLEGQYRAVNYALPEVEKPVLREEKTTGLGKYIPGALILLLAFYEFSKGTALSIGGGLLLTFIGISVLVIAGEGEKVEFGTAVAKQNRAEMARYNEEVAVREADYRRRLPRIRVLEEEIAQLESGLKESRAVLAQMYGVDVIYPSYRGLANVCAIYDYIASGTATSLPEAYRILIAHIDAGEIVTNLEQIGNKLNQVMAYQYRTYLAVTEANERISRLQSASEDMSRELEQLGGSVSDMNSALRRIQNSSQLTAYYSERSAKQLEYLNHMSYYTGIFGNASALNIPPAV